MVPYRSSRIRLKKINQDIQNKGAIFDPLAALGLKEEGTEKFVETQRTLIIAVGGVVLLIGTVLILRKL